MHASLVSRVVGKVAARLHLAAFANRFCLFIRFGAIGYAGLLLVSKLGVIPDVFAIWTVVVVPVVAGLLALVLYPRPTRSDAAHAIDERLRMKDLFLTATLLDTAPGEYKPVVAAEAQRLAASVRPATVVPFTVNGRAGQALVAMGVLALATWLPQFDLFGLNEQRQVQDQRRDQLVQTIKATQARKTILARAEPKASESPEVAHALDQLRKSFQNMKRDNPRGNLERLRDSQLALGELYKNAAERKQMEQSGQQLNKAMQQLGGMPNPEMRQMMDQAKQGDPTALKKKLEELKEQIKDAAKESDPAKKQSKEQAIQKALQELQSAAQQAGAMQMSQAMQNAIQQMQMAGMEGLNSEAMQGAMESLDLSQLEADQLAQMGLDEQAMKEALEAIQQAMQASAQQPLDGSDCDGLKAMAEYKAAFKKMCQGEGQGDSECDGTCVGVCVGLCKGKGRGSGSGMGGPGQGEGNVAPEDPNQQMSHKTEKAPSKFQPGKTLMSWKTRELSQAGEASKEYAQAAGDIRQAVSSAVLSDDVPPGYREVIQNYLHGVEKNLPAPATDSGDSNTSTDSGGAGGSGTSGGAGGADQNDAK